MMDFEAHGLEFFWTACNQLQRQLPRVKSAVLSLIFECPENLLLTVFSAQVFHFFKQLRVLTVIAGMHASPAASASRVNADLSVWRLSVGHWASR